MTWRIDGPTGAESAKLPGFNQLVTTPHGVYLANINDQYVGRSLHKYGEFSELEVEVFAQMLKPGAVVFDVGANIGAHTVRFAQMVGESGRVIAFEPQRVIYQTLCANVALNSLLNVDCYHAGVGEREDSMKVVDVDPRIENNFGGLSLDLPGPGEMVPILRLDGFIGAHRVDLLKIDVEGMEAAVLRGAEKLVEKFKPVLYVENDRPENSEELMRLIDSMGYRMYWHAPFLYREDNAFGDPENVFEGIASFNLLCFHKSADITIDLEEVTDFTFHPFNVKEQAA